MTTAPFTRATKEQILAAFDFVTARKSTNQLNEKIHQNDETV